MILAAKWYKVNSANISVKTFAKIIAIMNLLAMTHFFKTIYHNIFEYLLVVDSKDRRFFGLISTYFNIVETNG